MSLLIKNENIFDFNKIVLNLISLTDTELTPMLNF